MRSLRTSRRGAAAVLLAVALGACGDDGGSNGLPEVEGEGPPVAYRVVYEITTPDGRGREELVVHRPFEASVTERTPSGEVVAQRLTARGLLVTVDGDGRPTAIETAIAPAAADLRHDRFADRLVEAGHLEADEDGEVGGRPCRRTVETDTITTARPTTGGDATSPFPVRITRCVDAVGLVLEERVATPGGQVLRTKRAVELEVGGDVVPVRIPDVAPLPPAEGGGVVDDLAEHPEVVVGWRIRPPAGWVHAGTFVVEPARLGTSGGAAAALVTDVWVRGADVLQLDQGRVSAGATPFDPDTALEHVELPGVGPAVLAADLRQAEVRLAGADGGFLRVAGTLPIADLLEVARTLEPTSGDAPPTAGA